MHPQKASKLLTFEQALGVIQELRHQVLELKAENQKLKGPLSKNSRNSRKSPSGDDYNKPKPRYWSLWKILMFPSAIISQKGICG